MLEILTTVLMLLAGTASAAVIIVTAMDADFTGMWK